jgi:hypothetical protein
MLATTSRRHRLAPLPTICAAVLALALTAGCGDDGASPQARPSPSASASASVGGFQPASAEITAAVRDTWERYGRALESRDGDAAIPLVAPSAWPMYERQRKLALSAPEKELRAASFTDQVGALVLRAKLKPDTLRSARPQELFAFGIDQGLVNEAAGVQNRLGDITTDGEIAYAEHVYLGRTTENKFVFQLEDGDWKLDLIPVSQVADYAMFSLAMSQGKTKAEFVDLLMARLLGPAKARRIWKPIDPA